MTYPVGDTSFYYIYIPGKTARFLAGTFQYHTQQWLTGEENAIWPKTYTVVPQDEMPANLLSKAFDPLLTNCIILNKFFKNLKTFKFLQSQICYFYMLEMFPMCHTLIFRLDVLIYYLRAPYVTWF